MPSMIIKKFLYTGYGVLGVCFIALLVYWMLIPNLPVPTIEARSQSGYCDLLMMAMSERSTHMAILATFFGVLTLVLPLLGAVLGTTEKWNIRGRIPGIVLTAVGIIAGVFYTLSNEAATTSAYGAAECVRSARENSKDLPAATDRCTEVWEDWSRSNLPADAIENTKRLAAKLEDTGTRLAALEADKGLAESKVVELAHENESLKASLAASLVAIPEGALPADIVGGGLVVETTTVKPTPPPHAAKQATPTNRGPKRSHVGVPLRTTPEDE